MDGKPVEDWVLETDDLYELHQVEKGATEQEIKRAYRKLSLKLHPDRNQSPKAVAAFQKLQRAHTALNDPHKRAVFDSEGSKGLDAYELRGDQPDIHFMDVLFAFAKFFGAFPTAAEYELRRKHWRSGSAEPCPPPTQQQEKFYGKRDKQAKIIFLILMVICGVLFSLEADQRRPAASVAKDESNRYVFEHTVRLKSPNTAKNVKFYTRWTHSTLGEPLIAKVGNVVQRAVEAECASAHALRQGWLLRKKDAEKRREKSGFATFNAKRLGGTKRRTEGWRWAGNASAFSNTVFSLPTHCRPIRAR